MELSALGVDRFKPYTGASEEVQHHLPLRSRRARDGDRAGQQDDETTLRLMQGSKLPHHYLPNLL